MKFLTKSIVKYQNSLLVGFLTLALIGLVLFTQLKINYNMVDYLPKDAQSTIAINLMESEFKQKNPNARILLANRSIHEVLVFKKQITNIPGIENVLWLDDVVGESELLTTPLAFFDPQIIHPFYQDGSALLNVAIQAGLEVSTQKALRTFMAPGDALAGEAINAAITQEMAVSEVLNALLLVLPIIIVILIIASVSWIEPLLYLITIAVAILINLGTSYFWGEISYITQTVAPILQLAVSLDYAIFLMHAYNDLKQTKSNEVAMQLAVKQAIPTVAASAATTIIGFIALLFMRFEIGLDLGLHLAKGVMFSFLAVILFLPALILKSQKWLDKTQHKSFMPNLTGLKALLLKLKGVVLVLALVTIIPAFLGQARTDFMYGMGEIANGGPAGQELALIEAKFGKDNPLVLLVKTASPGIELTLAHELQQIPYIDSVVAYTTAVGAEIPPAYVPVEVNQQFYGENYTRLILYTSLPEEGKLSFQTVETVLQVTNKYYNDYYLTGQSAILDDMKNVVEADTQTVNLIAILGILLVLLINFRSIILSVVLVLSIELAIWLNLSVAYFANHSLSFIGYLIISTVQLGATVDYAILLTNTYREKRLTNKRQAALKEALASSLPSLLTSAGILAMAGFALRATSKNPIIAELGMLLGRGTLLSLLSVVTVLPAALALLDQVIFRKKYQAQPERRIL